MNDTLKKWIEDGIPVAKANFHLAVDNADKIPESYLARESDVISRRAEMWYTPHGLIVCQIKQTSKKKDKEKVYFVVPLPTVAFAHFVEDAPTQMKPARGAPEQPFKSASA
jgi:hypothetical protein